MEVLPITETKLKAEATAFGSKAVAIRAWPLTRQKAAEASELLVEATKLRQTILEWIEPDVKRAFELHKSLVAKRSELCRGVDAVISATKTMIAMFTRQEERKAIEERERLRLAALKEAEARRQAEVDALVAEAAATNDEGLLGAAEALEEAPLVPSAPVVAPEPPRVAGVATVSRKVGTVEDPVALLMWLLDVQSMPGWNATKLSDGLPTYQTVYRIGEPKRALINELVTFSQGDINRALNRGLELPGVRVEEGTSVRRLGR